MLRTGSLLAAMGLATLSSQAMARAECEPWPLVRLTTPSADKCLQIRGGVRTEYDLRSRDLCPTDSCDDARSYALGDLLFSDIRIGFNPGLALVAPDPIGLLETGTPVATPAYTTSVGYSGFSFGLSIDSRVDYPGFVPLGVGLDLVYGQLDGRGSGGSQAFGNLGVPSVGLINGAFAGGATTVSSTDITINRTWAALDKSLKVPFASGEHEFLGMDTAYTAYGLIGTRLGGAWERQRVDIATSAGTVLYDTQLNGGLMGAYLGLGVDKTMPVSDDLVLGLNSSIAVGFDVHRYRVTDSVSGTFGGLTASTNSFDAALTVPTFKLGAGLHLGSGNWTIGIDTAVSTGYYPALEVNRPISNQPSTPTVTASTPPAYEFLIGTLLRF